MKYVAMIFNPINRDKVGNTTSSNFTLGSLVLNVSVLKHFVHIIIIIMFVIYIIAYLARYQNYQQYFFFYSFENSRVVK